ncbi:MAG: PDZ domain-containing protein [Planctomycetia bacterium]|nr:PDZ domain-containing protein [Planctomycetia bacterium]
MPQRSLVSFLAAACFWSILALAAFAATPVSAQIRILPEHAQGSLSVLQRGAGLENQRRWGDALTLYEDSLRESPDDPSVRDRHDVAKIHYDLGRRYHDASFRRDLLAQQPAEALDAYAEVLLKIDSHYVANVDWQQLTAWGNRSVEIAIGEPCFAEAHLRGVSAERITAFRQGFATLAQGQVIHDRQDARAYVATVGQLAQRELGVTPTPIILEYLCGAVDALDTYSAYLTSDQLRDVYAQIDGNFVGLGIELKSDADALLIVNVITDSPAQRAGIKAGDHILRVGPKSTRGLSTDEAANLLQGAENSDVNLLVATGQEEPRPMTIRRQHIEVPSIDHVKILDASNGVGYMKLNTFQRNTSRDLDAALWNLHRQGMRSLIIDLRGNPGGLLSASVEAADRFVAQGTIVSTRGRNKLEDFDYTARQPSVWRVPLVVLIDSQSASASEIFAGAMRDHHRATIVGKRSYGKGSVQGIFPLAAAGCGLRLTTAKFYSPSGRPISNVGVTPDVVVQTAARPTDAGLTPDGAPDESLSAALQVARNSVAQR